MALTMWQIPASSNFVKYMAVVGVTTVVPGAEQKYLGHQLTTRGSLAKKVTVNDNDLRFLPNFVIQKRTFYYQASSTSWFVKVDGS